MKPMRSVSRLLDPLGSPRWRLEGCREVLSRAIDLCVFQLDQFDDEGDVATVLELHLQNSEVAENAQAQQAPRRMSSWQVSVDRVQVGLAANALTRLRPEDLDLLMKFHGQRVGVATLVCSPKPLERFLVLTFVHHRSLVGEIGRKRLRLRSTREFTPGFRLTSPAGVMMS